VVTLPGRSRRGAAQPARDAAQQARREARAPLADVLTALRDGASPGIAAARTGHDPALVDVMVDHYRRLGLVADPGCAGPCVGAGTAVLPPGCRGCPLAG
jgi:hypothetical protein